MLAITLVITRLNHCRRSYCSGILSARPNALAWRMLEFWQSVRLSNFPQSWQISSSLPPLPLFPLSDFTPCTLSKRVISDSSWKSMMRLLSRCLKLQKKKIFNPPPRGCKIKSKNSRIMWGMLSHVNKNHVK